MLFIVKPDTIGTSLNIQERDHRSSFLVKIFFPLTKLPYKGVCIFTKKV
jgi:hypothetical protein